jgi:hypothetical protein
MVAVLLALLGRLATATPTRSHVSAVVSCGEEQADAVASSPAAIRTVVSFFMIPSIVGASLRL